MELVRTAAKRLGAVAEATPWTLIPVDWLERLEQEVDPMITALEAWVSTADEARPDFPLTWSHGAALWQLVGLFLPALPSDDPEARLNEVSDYRHRLEQIVQQLESRSADLGTRLGSLQSDLDGTDQRREADLQTFEAALADTKSTLEQQKARLDDAIRQNQEQFSTAQETNRAEFAKLTDDAKTRLDSTLTGLTSDASERLAEAADSADAKIAGITDLEARATKSFQAIATASMAGHYQQRADEEAKNADRWRLIAAGVVVLGLVAAIVEFAISEAWSPNEALGRLPIAILVVGSAGAALRESSQHRRREHDLRDREVDVSSIDPYLATITDEEEVDRLKVRHARHLFLKDHDTGAEPTEPS